MISFNTKTIIFSIYTSCLLVACSSNHEIEKNVEQQQHLVFDIPPYNTDGELNAIIEIPAGTIEKWEINKESGELDIELINGKVRTVDYLPYPGNYGMIPQTLLPKELGGDGDPLDIIILGPSVEKGSIINCKLIGVLKLLDHGEQDDKLIAVQKGTDMYRVNTIHELDSSYLGVSENIATWFSNYKGPNKMKLQGYGEKAEAEQILIEAIEAFKKN